MSQTEMNHRLETQNIQLSAERKHGDKSRIVPRRVTAMIGPDRSITVTGENLSLDALIESLQALLTKAREARKNNLRLSTFLEMLKDMARA